MHETADDGLATVRQIFAVAQERMQVAEDIKEWRQIAVRLRMALKLMPVEHPTEAQRAQLADIDNQLRILTGIGSVNFEPLDRPDPDKELHFLEPILLPELLLAAGVLGMIAKVGGSFLEAFGQKLGERVAERIADRLGRVRAHDEKTRTIVEVAQPSVRFEVAHGQRVPDEAWLALLSMELSEPHLDGATLRWNAGSEAWLPIESPQKSMEHE